MITVRCFKCGDEIEEDENYGMAPDGNIACLDCAVTLISEERDAAIATAKLWRSVAKSAERSANRLSWIAIIASAFLAGSSLFRLIWGAR